MLTVLWVQTTQRVILLHRNVIGCSNLSFSHDIIYYSRVAPMSDAIRNRNLESHIVSAGNDSVLEMMVF